MPIKIRNANYDWEFSASFGHAQGAQALAFRDVWHARSTVVNLFSHTKDLGRFRGFLSTEVRWADVAKYDNVALFQRVAQSLCSGGIQLRMQEVVHAQFSKPNAPVAIQETELEAWVEPEPEPEANEAPEQFAVAPEQARALAAENRALAESGAPFKEVCQNQANCPVCSAGHTVMA